MNASNRFSPEKTLIVGGVAGGASAAARLRRLREDMEIILLERGEFISFANCGLPYYIGGVIGREDALTLQTPESFRSRFDVEVRIFSEVLAIDRKNKQVTVRRTDTGETYTEGYDKLILAPGAEPVRLPVPGGDLPHVHTLRTIPDSAEIRRYIREKGAKNAVIAGGGYIGLEMAENLHQLGLHVTVVELSDHVLAPFDADIACEIHAHLRKNGVELFCGRGVAEITPREVILSDGHRIPADLVISAVGVFPESGLAKDCGLELGVRGTIRVNEYHQTTDPDIYAVGDAAEVTHFVSGRKAFIPLAGPANKQGRLVADHIAGRAKPYKGTQGTSIVGVFGMTAACTGLGEKALAAEGLPYEVTYTFSASHAGYYPGAEPMAIKLLFSPEDGRLYGAQVVGFSGADKRLDILATALRAGMTVRDLTELELAYAPPYSSAKDPVNIAGYAAENLLDGLCKAWRWEKLDELNPAQVTFLDVRTPYETARGTLPHSVQIPLDELRERIHELDSSKPVYVNCQSGLRSYYACRILSQRGFDCYNMTGGYRLYALLRENAAYLQESPR